MTQHGQHMGIMEVVIMVMEARILCGRWHRMKQLCTRYWVFGVWLEMTN